MIKNAVMRYYVVFLLFLGASPVFSQTIIEIDSVSSVLCIELEKTHDVSNDTIRYNNLIETQINKYLGTVEAKNVDRVGRTLYYRLQRNCQEFVELLDRLHPGKKNEIKRVVTKPKSTISKKDLKLFKKTDSFFYYEVNGDRVDLTMSEGKWEDSFKDQTTSKLDYEWISETDFLLTFIGSDNDLRKNFSVPGDQFLYSVISKEKDYFILTVKIPSHTKYDEIKLYYN